MKRKDVSGARQCRSRGGESSLCSFNCRVFQDGFSRHPHFLAVMPDARFPCVSLTQVVGGHRCAPPVESSL